MSKKTMLLALAAVSAAMFALPAVASAKSAHLSQTGLGFTGVLKAGTTWVWKTSTNSTVTCTAVAATGSFNAGSSTAGTVDLDFTGCKNNLGLTCSSGATAGTIKTTTLPFHLIMAGANKAGILLTGNGAGVTEQHFADFSCFGVTVQMFGNGIIGTIEEPCGTASNRLKVEWTSTAHGTQADMVYTGTNYDLKSKIGSGTHHETTSVDATAEFTFNGGATPKLECT